MRRTRRFAVPLFVAPWLLLPPVPFPLGAQAAVPLWSLTRDVRFGSDTNMAAMLVRPEVVTVSPTNQTFVFDGGTRQIKIYDAAGAFVRAVGREGQGPGEFNSVHALGFLGDTLWASDPGLQRVTFFPPGRGNPTTFRLSYKPAATSTSGRNGIGAPPPTAPRAMLAGGLAVAERRIDPAGGEIPATGSPVVLMRRDGTFADTIAMLIYPSRRHIRLQFVNRRGTSVGAIESQPFQALPLWRARPDGRGVVIIDAPIPAPAEGAAFRIQRFDSAGRVLGARVYPYQPVALTAHVRDSVIRLLVNHPLAVATKQDATRMVREQLTIPAFLPTVTDLRVGRDGSLWLRREVIPNDGRLWSIIDPSGALVARVMAPPGARLLYADMERVLTLERDADDVPWVVRYRLSR